MNDHKDKGDTLIDMNEEVLQIIMDMMKKPNGEGNIMKIGVIPTSPRASLTASNDEAT